MNNSPCLDSNLEQTTANNLHKQQVMFAVAFLHCLITNNDVRKFVESSLHVDHIANNNKNKELSRVFSNLFTHVSICDQFLIIVSHVASGISFFPKPIHNEKNG